MSEWWETLFSDENYLVFYADEVATQEDRRDAQAIAQLLRLPDTARVLDAGCGWGRHCLALAELGREAVGVDISLPLLQEGIRRTIRERFRGQSHFCRADYRHLPFLDRSFDVVTSMFTSFGFFSDEQHNVKCLREFNRVLRPGGWCLIDLANRFREPFTRQKFVCKGDRILLEADRFDFASGWLRVDWQVYRAGKRIVHENIGWRAYVPVELQGMLVHAGFESPRFFGDLDGRDFGRDTPRMIAAARVGRDS